MHHTCAYRTYLQVPSFVCVYVCMGLSHCRAVCLYLLIIVVYYIYMPYVTATGTLPGTVWCTARDANHTGSKRIHSGGYEARRSIPLTRLRLCMLSAAPPPPLRLASGSPAPFFSSRYSFPPWLRATSRRLSWSSSDRGPVPQASLALPVKLLLTRHPCGCVTRKPDPFYIPLHWPHSQSPYLGNHVGRPPESSQYMTANERRISTALIPPVLAGQLFDRAPKSVSTWRKHCCRAPESDQYLLRARERCQHVWKSLVVVPVNPGSSRWATALWPWCSPDLPMVWVVSWWSPGGRSSGRSAHRDRPGASGGRGRRVRPELSWSHDLSPQPAASPEAPQGNHVSCRASHKTNQPRT